MVSCLESSIDKCGVVDQSPVRGLEDRLWQDQNNTNAYNVAIDARLVKGMPQNCTKTGALYRNITEEDLKSGHKSCYMFSASLNDFTHAPGKDTPLTFDFAHIPLLKATTLQSGS